MLGCDYCESIRGIGPKRAVELIEQHKSIEEILKNIDTKKYIVPEDWNYQQARQLFINPVVADPNEIEVNHIIPHRQNYIMDFILIVYCIFFFSQLKWTEPDEEGLVEYMCGDRQFNEERIRAGCKKIQKTRTTSTQGRLESFFKVLPSTPTNNKRKSEQGKKEPSAKKAKTGSRRGPK